MQLQGVFRDQREGNSPGEGGDYDKKQAAAHDERHHATNDDDDAFDA